MNTPVACVAFKGYRTSIFKALDLIGAADILSEKKKILIKPNLVDDIAPPFTTPVECITAIILYIREHSRAEITIAEGAGGDETDVLFKKYGYVQMAKKVQVGLVDLNQATEVCARNEAALVVKEFFYPALLKNNFIITVPTLKAHSMTQVTLGLKSMIGIAPPRHYERSGNFKKSRLHGKNNSELHKIIFDINAYIKPDLTIIDASVGCAEAHLWGKLCNPPRGKIIASFDVVGADSIGVRELGFSWDAVEHIRLAHGVLGDADNIDILN